MAKMTELSTNSAQQCDKCEEKSDEIERLRAALREVRRGCREDFGTGWVTSIAKEALKDE